MHASRSVSISLIISFIAVFMYSDFLTEEAAADCDVDAAVYYQIVLGYLAGGATVVVGSLLAAEKKGWESRQDYSGAEIAAMSTAYILTTTITVNHVGQKAGCHGSFLWTLGGAVAAPVVGSVTGGIVGGIKGRDKDGILVGSLAGSVFGFLLTPISATIAYHLTKGKNNPDKKEIIVPLMRMRF